MDHLSKGIGAIPHRMSILSEEDLAPTQPNRSPRSRVVQMVQDWIRSGALRPGDLLPSERKLADQLGVARLTARFALLELERAGVIETGGRKRRLAAQNSNPLMAKTVVLVSTIRHSLSTSGESRVQVEVENSLQKAGFNPLLFNPNAAPENRLYELLQERPAGFIVLAEAAENPAVREFAIKALDMQVPVIVHSGEDAYRHTVRITSDHEAGGYDVTRWLIDHGCRRILRLWTRQDAPEWLRRRTRGVERAITEAGLPLLPEIIALTTSRDPDALPDAKFSECRVRQLLGFLFEHLQGPNRIDGIVAINDPDALQLTAACRLGQREPGRDILIAGYDNFWNNCQEYFFEKTPPAVTVDKNNDLAGQMLVQEFEKRNQLKADNSSLILVPHRVVTLSDQRIG